MTTLNDCLADLRVDCSLAGHIFRRIPLDWLAVLQDVQEQCPSAVIAGGALRDLWFGGDVKDIDIFVPAAESNGLLTVDGWANKTIIPYGLTYRFGTRDEVVAVQEFTVLGLEQPVQVVHLKDVGGEFPWFVRSRMDFDVCRVTFDGQCVGFEEHFARAALRRRFTLINCEDAIQAKRSLKRAIAFRARYPDITIDTSLADAFFPQFEEGTEITRRHPFTGVVVKLRLNVTDQQMADWRAGVVAQRAFSNLSADEREFIISGIPPGDWDKFIPEESA